MCGTQSDYGNYFGRTPLTLQRFLQHKVRLGQCKRDEASVLGDGLNVHAVWNEKASIVAVLVHILVLANSYLIISHLLLLVCGGSGVHWIANFAGKKRAVTLVPSLVFCKKEPLCSVKGGKMKMVVNSSAPE